MCLSLVIALMDTRFIFLLMNMQFSITVICKICSNAVFAVALPLTWKLSTYYVTRRYVVQSKKLPRKVVYLHYKKLCIPPTPKITVTHNTRTQTKSPAWVEHLGSVQISGKKQLHENEKACGREVEILSIAALLKR